VPTGFSRHKTTSLKERSRDRSRIKASTHLLAPHGTQDSESVSTSVRYPIACAIELDEPFCFLVRDVQVFEPCRIHCDEIPNSGQRGIFLVSGCSTSLLHPSVKQPRHCVLDYVYAERKDSGFGRHRPSSKDQGKVVEGSPHLACNLVAPAESIFLVLFEGEAVTLYTIRYLFIVGRQILDECRASRSAVLLCGCL
jgi:hypothetical protein